MYAVVESRNNEIQSVQIETMHGDAVNLAAAMAEYDGAMSREQAYQEVMTNGYYEDGEFRVTVIAVS